MDGNKLANLKVLVAALAVAGLMGGCASREWVRDYVKQQTGPIQSDTEARTSQLDSKIGLVDSRVTLVSSETSEARKVADEGVRKADGANVRLSQAMAQRDKVALVDKTVLRFRVDSDALSKTDRKALDAVKEKLAGNPTYTAHIIGEADRPGSERYNEALSSRRAEEVRRYLAESDEASLLQRIDVLPAGEDLAPSKKADPQHRAVTIAIYKPAYE